jgi:hypothetical protein
VEGETRRTTSKSSKRQRYFLTYRRNFPRQARKCVPATSTTSKHHFYHHHHHHHHHHFHHTLDRRDGRRETGKETAWFKVWTANAAWSAGLYRPDGKRNRTGASAAAPATRSNQRPARKTGRQAFADKGKNKGEERAGRGLRTVSRRRRRRSSSTDDKQGDAGRATIDTGIEAREEGA